MKLKGRMMNKILCALGGTLLLAACSSKNYCGTYEGVLPAADAPGIASKLRLDKNGTYHLTSVYIDKKDGTFVESGSYFVNDSVITISRDGQGSYFKAEDGRLRMLDMEKKEIKGPLADNYILKKTQNCE